MSDLERPPTLADFKEGTVAWLIQKFIEMVSRIPGKEIGRTHMYSLRMLQRAPIGAIMAESLTATDIINHALMRRETVCPATINQDLTYLRGPLSCASVMFGLKGISVTPLIEAKPHLEKFGLVGKSRPRDRRPTVDEAARLMAYFEEQDKHSKIPMMVLLEFAWYSARRFSEICNLRWGDVNGADMTCIVRDMKDPRHKKGNHHEFPLLGRAWDIVMAQPRLTDDPDERIFPYNSKSAGARYTRAKKELAIFNLRFHDNRREAASRLFEQGYGVAEVMVVTGHKNPQMLMRTYTKLKAADLHKGPAGRTTAQ